MSRFTEDIPFTDLDQETDPIINTGPHESDNSVFQMDYEEDPGFGSDHSDRGLTKSKPMFSPPSYSEISGSGSNVSRGSSSVTRAVPKVKKVLKSAMAKRKKRSGEGYELTGRRRGYRRVNFESDFESDESDEIEIDLETHGARGYRREVQIRRFTFVLFILSILLLLLYSAYSLSGGQGALADMKPILSNGTSLFYPTTLVISLDGFHPHYISKKLTPKLHDLLKNVGGAPYITPSFPSSTFPNHWTLVTGLYPSSHGIVGNTFYDTHLDAHFHNTVAEESLDVKWWGGQPIWQTAAFQGVSTAVHMWPGSEVLWNKGQPEFVDKFNKTEKLERKVSRILEFLDLDIRTRPELILSYAPIIDTLGHKYGIAGDELSEGLRQVDSFVDSLLGGIESRNLTSIVNIVILSDHGMAPTSNERLMFLEDLVNTTKIEHIDGWPLFGLRPYSEYSVEEVYNEIRVHHKKLDDPKWRVFLKDDLPAEWNFGGSNGGKFQDRIAPVWIIPHEGYAITTREDYAKMDNDFKPRGIHGYNNTEVLMRGLFLGIGPYFRDDHNKYFKYEPFENTNVYGILCDTLNLLPALNNGSATIDGNGNTKLNLPKLNSNWEDERPAYPGLSYKVDYLKEEATFDILYRSTNDEEPEVPQNFDTPTDHDDSAKDDIDHSDSNHSDSNNSDSNHSDNNNEQTGTEEDNSNQNGDDKGKSWVDEIEDHVSDAWGSVEDFIEDIEDKITSTGSDKDEDD